MRLISQGAEAKVYETEFLGKEAILKVRPAKNYRHPELDCKLRNARTKNEARVMREARRAGVRTPVIFDIDLRESSITMERIKGDTVKDTLDRQPERSLEICSLIGETLARLHNGGISHGDLTTSNMLISSSGELCLIDLSLGNTVIDIEEMGVDIHLLERAFTSAHSGIDESFDSILAAYGKHMKNAESVFAKVEEIRSRGRYT